LTNFGAFVEIEDGIDGLVHISDMSWTKRIRHPNEVVKKGQELEVVVLNIDKERRRISLGHKQTIENPWAELAVTYAVGNPANGKVSRLLERGVVVDLDGDVEGFVPASQLSIDEVEHPEDCFEEGDPLPLKVVEFDEEQKKIVLSVREYLRDAPEEEVTAFVEAHQPREGAAEAREAAAAAGASEDGASAVEASEDAEGSEAEEKVEA
jgi:small subunit ribosomal protein S1